MRRQTSLSLGCALLLMVHSSWVIVCQSLNGTPTDVSYDLSNVFNSNNNRPGQVVTLPEKSGWIGVNTTCPAGTTMNYIYRSYVTKPPVQSTENGFQYLKLNDYLLGAMSITDSSAGLFHPPRNYIRVGTHPNVPKQQPFGVMDSKLVFKLKVIRSFINMVPISRQTMFRAYVTTSTGDALSTPVYTISYSGKVEVPQNCEVNVGQTVEFDFGDIGVSLFSKAGAGNRPEGINPQTKTVATKCTNVAAQAYLTMRVEVEKASGQMMVSDSPDSGLVVADKTGRPLTPNNPSSTISLQLDGNAAANMSIRTWPVNVIGNKPTKGPFAARGYLRVDYD